MFDTDEVVVVRLGHRPGRDERTTTHVALTARAFGADRIIVPSKAGSTVETVEDVTERFGGPFTIEQLSSPISWVADWDGAVVHLTMYGLPVEETIGDIRTEATGSRLAILVGGGKVTADLFDLATWNVAVTNQPHSEIAALAVFLDRLFEVDLSSRHFEDASERVIPSARGKHVETLDGDS